MSDGRKPRRLHRPMPNRWWMKKRNYLVFMLREVSAVFVALVAVATIVQVMALKRGPEAYATFMDAVSSPPAVLVALVALGFALLHSITFFLLAGKVMVVEVGEERIPPAMIVAGHFGAWAFLSGLFVVFVL